MSSGLKRASVVGGSEIQNLEDLRLKIDKVDKELVALLEQRASLVFSVGDYKRKHQLPVYDPERERKIKNKIRHLISSTGPLSAKEMESLFMTLIEQFRFFESAHMQKDKVETEFQHAHLDFSKSQNVLMWGFGLLGASFYLALNKSFPHWDFRVVDPYLNVDEFLAWKVEHQLTNIDLIHSQQMGNADIYVLAGPVDRNLQHLTEFNFPEKSLVFDLGSTKKIMTEVFQKRQLQTKNSFIYIGGHPLAGRESSGFKNGDPLLFYNKTFCWVTSTSQVVKPSIKSTFDILASCLGAKPFWMEADEHDEALAWTSHLPQILSGTLAGCFAEKSFSLKAEIFPGVIRELLRISGSNFTMWQSIIETNQPQLQKVISEVIEKLKQVQQDLKTRSGSEKFFYQANDFYKKFKKGA